MYVGSLLDILVVLAPLAALCSVLPDTRRYAFTWLRLFMVAVFMQAVQLIILRVATAVGFVDFHSALHQPVRGSKYIRRLGISSQGDHRRVFEQQQHIRNACLLAQLDNLLLQAQPRRVINIAELENGNHEGSFQIANRRLSILKTESST